MRSFDLTIVGQSIITDILATYALGKGISSVCCIDTSNAYPHSSLSHGVIYAHSFDYMTRFVNAHGKDFANLYYQKFSRNTSRALPRLSSMYSSHIKECEFLRRVSNQHEQNEFEKNIEILKELGIEGFSECTFRPELLNGLVFSKSHNPCYFLEEPRTSKILRTSCDAARILLSKPSDLIIDAGNQGFQVNVGEGEVFNTHVLVLADHFQIRDLIPPFKDVLISYTEQLQSFVLDENLDGAFQSKPHLMVSNYSNEYFIRNNQTVKAGGFRYLEKYSGIESTTTIHNEMVVKKAHEKVKEIYGRNCQFRGVEKYYDCLPCDELPVVGPMFGEQGLYLITGFANQVLGGVVGWGESLMELIQTGASNIPRRLFPERHRTLQDSHI